MPIKYDIKLYYNTGFGPVNIPDRPALLDLCQSRDFPSLLLRQDRGLSEVKIQASWDEVKDVDYAKIGASYYAVGCPVVMNDGTITLPLAESGLMGLGGPLAVEILDGWVTRAHAASDELFENILPEPFNLSRPQEMDTPITIDPLDEDETPAAVLVGATVDLGELKMVADVYASTGTDPQTVTVPRVPPVQEGTEARMKLPTRTDDPIQSYTAKNKLPNLRLFDFKSKSIKEGVESVRSLGLETAITACYTIPGGYFEEAEKEAGTDKLASISGTYKRFAAAAIPYEWDTGGYEVRNKKVYTLYHEYHLRSISSGDGADYTASDIYRDGRKAPEVLVYTDPTPNGCPFYAFAWYKQRRTLPFENAVKGSPWQNTPIAFTTESGSLLSSVERGRNYQREYGFIGNLAKTRDEWREDFGALGPGFGDLAAIGYDAVAGISRFGSELFGAAGSIIGTALGGPMGGAAGGAIGQGVAKGLNAGDARAELQYQNNMSTNMQAPDIKYARADSIQNYVGNGVTVFRTRPSIEDTKRLDKRLTMYGYAQDKPFERSDMTNRRWFNYLQLSSLTIKTDMGLYLRMLAQTELLSGVRIWHVLPNESYYDNNPIVEVTRDGKK